MSKQSNCKNCGKSFPYRQGKIYCCEKCSLEGWRNKKGLEPCTYCGAPSSTIDHVPPRVSRDRIIEEGLESVFPFKEVPCCSQCNCALGCHALWTINERRGYIQHWLSNRYKNLIQSPTWTESELEELGYCLQESVKARQLFREFILDRIAWARGRKD